MIVAMPEPAKPGKGLSIRPCSQGHLGSDAKKLPLLLLKERWDVGPGTVVMISRCGLHPSLFQCLGKQWGGSTPTFPIIPSIGFRVFVC